MVRTMCSTQRCARVPGKGCRRMKTDGALTAILDLQLGVDELIALQDLPQPTPLMSGLACPRRLAKRQIIIVVRLLRVVVLRRGRKRLSVPPRKATNTGSALSFQGNACTSACAVIERSDQYVTALMACFLACATRRRFSQQQCCSFEDAAGLQWLVRRAGAEAAGYRSPDRLCSPTAARPDRPAAFQSSNASPSSGLGPSAGAHTHPGGCALLARPGAAGCN